MNPEESFSEIGSEETVLWEGRQSSNTVWRAAACNGWLPVLLLWLFCHMFLFTDIWRDILNGHPVLFLFGYLLPVWGYLYKGYKLFRNGESAHYCITDKSIYASYKGRKICKPLSEICRTEYLKGRLSDVSDVGTVRCVYRKLNGRVPDPDESAEFCILLRMVDDYRKNTGSCMQGRT